MTAIETIRELKEEDEEDYDASISQMREAYKRIEHAYNVLGTGFDLMSYDGLNELARDLEWAAFLLGKAGERIRCE